MQTGENSLVKQKQ